MCEILFFDIDRTIFDTEESGQRIIKSVSRVSHKTINEIERIISNYKSKLEFSTDFNPNELLRAIVGETGIGLSVLNQAMFKPENFVLYPESLILLEKLNRQGCLLGIFSEGVRAWQMKKLTLTKVAHYITPSLIIIERRKLLPISVGKLLVGATVIDDKRYVVETLKQQRHDLNIVWINRKDNESINGVTTIKNLNNLIQNYD